LTGYKGKMADGNSLVYPSASSGRVMGIDFGSKRIGVAISDPMGIIAGGLGTFPNDHHIWNTILDIVKKMSITKIVIGRPIRLSGEEGSSSSKASEFGKRLKERLHEEYAKEVEIIEWDERFTTTMAQRTQIELGIKKKERRKKANLDRIASQLILQSYLDFQSHLKNSRGS
jgi:putative Holliday junction resolvase